MSSGKSSGRLRRSGRRRVGAVWVGVLLVVVALLAGTLGHAAAAPTAGSPTPQLFASLPSPIAVAATPTELLALSSSSCSTVYAISAGGSVSTFATLASSVTRCLEGAIAISPGLGNFTAGEVYVLQDGSIFEIPAGGSSTPVPAALSVANLQGTAPGLAFDYSGSFGFALLATGGANGNAYAIGPTNVAQFLGSFGTVVEGPAVAPTSFGSFGGDLVVASEGKSPIYAMTSTSPHSVSQFSAWSRSEAVSFVPSLACSFSTTGYAYFVANYSGNQILAMPSSAFSTDAGSALLLSEPATPGVGIAGSNGVVTSSFALSGISEGAAYVACPIGIAQEVDLTHQGFDTTNGSGLDLIGFDPASGQLVGVDPTNAPSKIFLLEGGNGHFTQNVSVGLDPSSVTYNPKTNELFVANTGSNNITVLNATTYAYLGSIPIDCNGGPVSVTYNAQNTKLYVANAGDHTVDVFSLTNNLFSHRNQVVRLNGIPAALVSNPFDGNVYVVGSGPGGTGAVWEIHAFKVVKTVLLPSPASSIAVNATSGTLFVTVPGSNELLLLGAGDHLEATVSLPSPVGVAYDAYTGLEVVVSSDGMAWILHGSSILTSFQLGLDPGMLVYDPVSDLVYCTADVTISGSDPRLVIGSSS